MHSIKSGVLKCGVPATHPKLDHLGLEAHGSGDPNHHPSQFLFIPRGTIRAGILKTSSGRAEALWSLKTPSSVDRWIWSGSCGVEPLFWLNMGVMKSHKKSPGLRDKSSETGPFSMVIFVGLLEGTLPKINRWEESSTGCLGDQATGCCKACSSMIQLSSKSPQIYCNICILCLKLGESVLDLIGF